MQIVCVLFVSVCVVVCACLRNKTALESHPREPLAATRQSARACAQNARFVSFFMKNKKRQYCYDNVQSTKLEN